MEGLLYVLIPALILGSSWGLRVFAAKTMKNNHEEGLKIKAMEE